MSAAFPIISPLASSSNDLRLARPLTARGGARGARSARAATHGREQTELVVGIEAVVGLDIVVPDSEEGVRAVAREVGMPGDDRLPGRLHGAALGDIQVQPFL